MRFQARATLTLSAVQMLGVCTNLVGITTESLSSCRTCTFRAWQKYDVDQALKKIEEEENEEKALKDKVIGKTRKEA